MNGESRRSNVTVTLRSKNEIVRVPASQMVMRGFLDPEVQVFSEKKRNRN